MSNSQPRDLKYAADWLRLARTQPSRATFDRSYPDCELRQLDDCLEKAGGSYEDIGTSKREIDYLAQWGKVGEACKQYLMVEAGDAQGIEAQDEGQYRLEAATELQHDLGLDDAQFEAMLALFREHRGLQGIPAELYAETRTQLEPIIASPRRNLEVFMAEAGPQVAEIFPEYADAILNRETGRKLSDPFCVDLLSSAGVEGAHFLHRLPEAEQRAMLEQIEPDLSAAFAKLPPAEQASLREFYDQKFAELTGKAPAKEEIPYELL